MVVSMIVIKETIIFKRGEIVEGRYARSRRCIKSRRKSWCEVPTAQQVTSPGEQHLSCDSSLSSLF